MMTAVRWRNRIRTNVKNYIKDLCTTVVDGQTDDNSSVAALPAVVLTQIQGNDHAVDFDNNDTGAIVGYQVDVYTNGSSKRTDAQKITSGVYEAFKKMGFQNVYYEDGVNAADTTICRTISRYRRYIGSGEEIAKI